MVTNAVLGLIGKIAMTGPEEVAKFVIILALNVPVVNDQADGGAGGQALEHPGEDLDLIGLSAAGGMGLHSGTAPGQFRFDFWGA
jgi:hypothetical protein